MEGRELAALTFEPDGNRVVIPDANELGRQEIWLLSGFPWDERD